MIVESFDRDSLARLAEALPGTPRALLFTAAPEAVDEAYADALAQATRLGCTAINPDQAITTRRMIEAAHEKGLAVHAWTVNEPQRVATLAGWGVDGLFSDVW